MKISRLSFTVSLGVFATIMLGDAVAVPPSKENDRTDGPAVAMIDLDTAGREIKKLKPEEFGLRRIEADKKRLVLEFEINELWEKLKMQVYRVAQGDRPMTGYRAFLYADGKMNYLEIPTHGGGGLQDATVIGDSLYLTSDWGSGVLRTMLYRVHRDEKDEIRTEEMGVLSSAPKGLVDEEFLKDKNVVQITEALRPLTLAKGPAGQGADQPATAVESKAESTEEPEPGSKPRPE